MPKPLKSPKVDLWESGCLWGQQLPPHLQQAGRERRSCHWNSRQPASPLAHAPPTHLPSPAPDQPSSANRTRSPLSPPPHPPPPHRSAVPRAAARRCTARWSGWEAAQCPHPLPLPAPRSPLPAPRSPLPLPAGPPRGWSPGRGDGAVAASWSLLSCATRAPGRVYKRGKLIGKGAFSRCYKLTDMSTSTVFALKVVPRGGPGSGVEREIALHSRLRHRNIVAFHGHFADRDHVYLVLEYCSRKSLAHVLEVRQTLTEPEVRYYLRGLVSGLRYLHQQRIVHRDLKLSNFFLNKNMEVKIGDLGLAARCCCGTPNFLAPEVVSRNGHSCQSDIWALGCIMYMVLTGDPPFVAASLSEMYKNIREGRYPEPAHLSPNACRLIARLLAPNPAERPSLDHLLQDNFFTQGFTPDRLPPHSCHSPPIFAVPQPLGRLFRKVGQLLMSQCQLPCPYTPHEAACPGEDGSDADFMEWGSEASLLERGALQPEVPVHLVTQGTLQSDPAGSEGSPRQEVEAAIRNLQLCLNPGPPGPRERAVAHPLGSQVGGLFQQVWLRLPAVGREQWCLVSGWYPHGPASPRGEERLPVPTQSASPGLCLLRFLASQQALLLLFSDGTVQVSCSGDQVQLVLNGGPEELLLTVWERGQPAASYPPGILQSHGCPPLLASTCITRSACCRASSTPKGGPCEDTGPPGESGVIPISGSLTESHRQRPFTTGGSRGEVGCAAKSMNPQKQGSSNYRPAEDIDPARRVFLPPLPVRSAHPLIAHSSGQPPGETLSEPLPVTKFRTPPFLHSRASFLPLELWWCPTTDGPPLATPSSPPCQLAPELCLVAQWARSQLDL
ncbi:hypothetical protein QTO34_015710, partial [Cnephaeus nilssonii]